MKNLCILGATGSVGTQTLDVVRNQQKDFCVKAISANTNLKKVLEIIHEFKVKYVAITNEDTYKLLKNYCKENNINVEVLYGIEGLNYISTIDEVDTVVVSVVGMAGFIPTLNAIKARKNIALANKETLIAGGKIVMDLASKYKVKILPVDSEHSAIFQCLQGNSYNNIKKILLTGSGGPFRGKKIDELENITPDQAIRHPKWNMGKKISVDSSTLMNKGLEVIEAHILFGVDYDNIQVIIHPESVIHSMVQYEDNSIIAQLAATDMKLPIQYALNYPNRKKNVVESLDFYKIKNLHFEEPDLNTFKCLKYAYYAGKCGGIMPTVLNSANEAAVNLFLNHKIKYLQIQQIIEECLLKQKNNLNPSVNDIIDIDKEIKKYIYSKY